MDLGMTGRSLWLYLSVGIEPCPKNILDQNQNQNQKPYIMSPKANQATVPILFLYQ